VSIAPHVLVAVPLAGLPQGAEVPVPEVATHHLRRVLRLTDGAPLSLTDGAGRVAAGVLAGEGARLTSEVRAVTAGGPRLVLAQAISKGRRAEDAVRVACELGVDRIVPVVAERTQGRPDARAAGALVERWRAVAVAALEQSRGARLAAIVAPVDGVDAVASEAPDPLRLIAVPGAPPLPEALDASATRVPERVPVGSPGEVIVAVGPEGGWSPAELERTRAAGWQEVGLGPTVLRTEHAGPVAVAVAAALLGRWSASVASGRP
jgi:16S rRNA (uracil1498-N3)-methyltransferase